jgi:hypothetical protein
MEEQSEKPKTAVDERKQKNKGKEKVGDESPSRASDIAHDFILDPRDETMIDRAQPSGETKRVMFGKKALMIGGTLPVEQEEQLMALLFRNLD